MNVTGNPETIGMCKNITKYGPYVELQSYGDKGEQEHRVVFKVDHQSFTVYRIDDEPDEDAIGHADFMAEALVKAINRLIEKEKSNGSS